VEITRIFAPRSMTLAICRLASGKYKGKSAILKYETLAAFPGALADAAERQPVLESTKVRLLLHIDKLKDGARQRKKNVPAVRRYLDAEKKHKAFYAEITELMKIVDEEIEGDRMKAQDRLRRMKYEQSKEDKNFENAKSIYLEWRERQREEDSPELAKAKQRLAEIESELGSLEADG
jgi:exonuclease VII large subunit